MKKEFFSIEQYKNMIGTIAYFPFSLKNKYLTISDIYLVLTSLGGLGTHQRKPGSSWRSVSPVLEVHPNTPAYPQLEEGTARGTYKSADTENRLVTLFYCSFCLSICQGISGTC